MTSSYPFKNFGLNRNRAIINTTDPSQDAGLGAARNTVGPGGGGIKRPVSPPIIHAQLDPATASTISGTPDGNGNYLQAGSTSQLLDDAGLGNMATWANVNSIPDTLSGHNLAGVAQPVLPTTSGTKHGWFSDSGGALYEAPVYGTEINAGAVVSASGSYTLTASFANALGQDGVIPNPGQTVNLLIFFRSVAELTGAVTVGPLIEGYFRVSVDGGSTWTDSSAAPQELRLSYATSSNNEYIPFFDMGFFGGLSPTADIHLQYYGKYTSQTGGSAPTLAQMFLYPILLPNSNVTIAGGTLTDTLVTTATTSATAIYPATTAAASKSLVGGSTGGVQPVTYSNSRTGNGSGTSDGGSVTSGATSATFIATTAVKSGSSGGTAYTGVYTQVATDSATPTPATSTVNCTLTSTIYQGYAAISAPVACTNGSCTYLGPPAECTASATFTVTASGGNGSYTYSNSVSSYSGTWVTNPTIATGATSASGTYSGMAAGTTKPGNTLTVTIQGSTNDTRNTGASVQTGTGTLTFYS